MKLKAIARLCAKSEAINVIDMPGNIGDTTLQWIGDLTAVYPVFDLPYLEKESIFAIFDVKSAKRDDYFFQCIGVPEGVNLNDSSESEEQIDQSEFDIDIIHSGVTMRPLKTSQGVTFIDAGYLAPLGDYERVELFERYNPQEEKIYIVAKVGMIVKAIIRPYDLINQGFSDKMWEFSRVCTRALEYKKS